MMPARISILKSVLDAHFASMSAPLAQFISKKKRIAFQKLIFYEGIQGESAFEAALFRFEQMDWPSTCRAAKKTQLMAVQKIMGTPLWGYMHLNALIVQGRIKEAIGCCIHSKIKHIVSGGQVTVSNGYG